MKNTKHTPGPWQCTKYPKVFSINAENGRQIAIMTEHHGDEPLTPISVFERSKQDAADAALIAAAPELLEALMQIDFAMAAGQYHEIDTVKMRAAIAKAKGSL